MDVVHSGNPGTFTANSGQTVRYDQSSSTSEVAGSTLLVASAGNASLGWTNTNANRLAHAVAAFAPATGCSSGGGGTNLVMVVGNTTLPVDDQTKKTLFESWGWTVSLLDDDTADYSSAAASNDVMFISESASGSTTNTKARDLNIGIVVEEDRVWDEMGFGTPGDGGVSHDTINITDDDHYITSPLSTGNLTVYSAGYEMMGSLGSPSPSLASGGESLANENAGSSPTLFVFDTGASLTSGNAANRRVGFPSKTSNPANWTADLETLLQRSLNWAAGNETGNVVTLELTLSSSEGGSVNMRTKVYLRNLP